MSLSRLSLPSISRVLEGEAEADTKNVTAQVQEDTNSSTASTSTSASLLPALVPQPHLMKTMDLRDHDLENEEVELFSFVLGFPDEAEADKDDAQTIFEERRFGEVHVELAELQEEQPDAPIRWLKINFAQWVMTIRRLFPVRFAEIFLRKAGQELAQR